MDLSSQNASLRKAYGLRSRHNDVVKHADIDESQSIFEPLGKEFVCPAWFADAARMVMRKDYCRSVAPERSFYHLSRIHRAPVNCTGEYLLEAKNAVSAIKEKAAEDFVFQCTELECQVAFRIGRIFDDIAARELGFENRGCDLYYVF